MVLELEENPLEVGVWRTSSISNKVEVRKVNLLGGTMQTLEKSLSYATAKNQTISNNIANVDTPHYSAKDVVFKDILNDQLTSPPVAKRTHPKHHLFTDVANQPFHTIAKTNTMYNHNGNNVDMDKEMAALAKNQIYYRGLVDRLNGKFGNLQTVIRGGR